LDTPAGPRRSLHRLAVAAAVAPWVARTRTAAAQATEGDPGAFRPTNGFVIEPSLLPAGSIVRGGPPRDGIPALDAPRVEPARSSRLRADDRVLGLAAGGAARAYPVRILNWHEVVNDRIAGEPAAVTYCPLCGSGVTFSSKVGERVLTFGVSGLLYDSDLLLYDRQTESLWSQLKFQAVTGPLIGTRLARLPAEHTTWAAWRRDHPGTEVLSFDTGHVRDYGRDPYAGYERDPATLFPVSVNDPRLPAKAWVVGVSLGGAAKAYPFDELARTGGTVRDTVAGRPVVVRYDPAARAARVEDGGGRALPSVTAFWFAWATFNPGTALFRADAPPR
jgi:hypothetical protein